MDSFAEAAADALPGAFRRVFGPEEGALARAEVIAAGREISRGLRREPESAPARAIGWLCALPTALAEVDDPAGALARALDRTLARIARELAAIDGTPSAARGDQGTPSGARGHQGTPSGARGHQGTPSGARREAWLAALHPAIAGDRRGHLGAIGDAWGALCGDPIVAGRWADRLRPEVAAIWERGDDAPQSRACLSALAAADRPRELLALLRLRPVALWAERRQGVLALAAMGEIDAAIAYARDSNPLGHASDAAIAELCESLLLAAGRREEAYAGFALAASPRPNCLLTFKAIAAKYPERVPVTILGDLLTASAGAEGRWFATARALGFHDLALEIAARSPVDPRTLTRAASESLAGDPGFARAAAVAALRWIAGGQGVEIDAADVLAAVDLAIAAAARGGAEAATRAEIVALCGGPSPVAAWMTRLVEDALADP